MEHKKAIKKLTPVYFCLHHDFKIFVHFGAFLLLCGLVSDIFTILSRGSELCVDICDSYSNFGYLKNLTFLFKDNFEEKKHIVLLV